MQFVEIPSGSAFFKADEYQDAKALLLEVEDFQRQVPTTYGPKDTAVATITKFTDGGEPAVNHMVKIQQTILARDLESMVGKATIVKLAKGQSNKAGQNDPWVWRQPEADVKAEVIAYAKSREEAIAKEAEEGPDF